MSYGKVLLPLLVLPFLAACGSTGSGSNDSSSPASASADSTPDQPYTIHQNKKPWRHWSKANSTHQTYNWQWNKVNRVSCTAGDSRGHFYVVVEDGYKGQQYQGMLGQIEDSAVDRCYADSHGDAGCTFRDCTPD